MKKFFPLFCTLLLLACYSDAGRADYEAGVKLLQGIGVEKNEAEGMRRLTLGSDAGYPPAEVTLGYLFLKGTGVAKKDDVGGFKLFLQAAKQGNRDGQYNAGLCYVRGTGTAIDLAQAFQWFKKAAMQDDAGSQYNLGVMYMNGEGVKADPILAYAWFVQAWNHEYNGAKAAMESVRRTLNADQLNRLDDIVGDIARSIAKPVPVSLSVDPGTKDQPL